jgi:hypothetical protein
MEKRLRIMEEVENRKVDTPIETGLIEAICTHLSTITETSKSLEHHTVTSDHTDYSDSRRLEL